MNQVTSLAGDIACRRSLRASAFQQTDRALQDKGKSPPGAIRAGGPLPRWVPQLVRRHRTFATSWPGGRPQRQRQKAPAAPGPEPALRGKPLYLDSDQAFTDSDGDRMQPVLRSELPPGAEEQCSDLSLADANSLGDFLGTVAVGRQYQAYELHSGEGEIPDISSLLRSALTHDFSISLAQTSHGEKLSWADRDDMASSIERLHPTGYWPQGRMHYQRGRGDLYAPLKLKVAFGSFA